MTHTPGPWKSDYLGVITGGSSFLTSVAETYAIKWANCQASSAHRHSQDAADYCGKMYDEAKANARLIAAAPELLEALKAMQFLAWHDGWETDGHQHAYRLAVSAIEKAGGEPWPQGRQES